MIHRSHLVPNSRVDSKVDGPAQSVSEWCQRRFSRGSTIIDCRLNKYSSLPPLTCRKILMHPDNRLRPRYHGRHCALRDDLEGLHGSHWFRCFLSSSKVVVDKTKTFGVQHQRGRKDGSTASSEIRLRDTSSLKIDPPCPFWSTSSLQNYCYCWTRRSFFLAF